MKSLIINGFLIFFVVEIVLFYLVWPLLTGKPRKHDLLKMLLNQKPDNFKRISTNGQTITEGNYETTPEFIHLVRHSTLIFTIGITAIFLIMIVEPALNKPLILLINSLFILASGIITLKVINGKYDIQLNKAKKIVTTIFTLIPLINTVLIYSGINNNYNIWITILNILFFIFNGILPDVEYRLY